MRAHRNHGGVVEDLHAEYRQSVQNYFQRRHEMMQYRRHSMMQESLLFAVENFLRTTFAMGCFQALLVLSTEFA